MPAHTEPAEFDEQNRVNAQVSDGNHSVDKEQS